MTDSNPSADLWCMHVRGPDDVHPAPDWHTAAQWAHVLNGVVAPSRRDDDNEPRMFAVPAPWPWSPEAHAEGLAVSIRLNSSPPPRTPPTDASEAAAVTAEQIDEAFHAAYLRPIGQRFDEFVAAHLNAALAVAVPSSDVRRVSVDEVLRVIDESRFFHPAGGSRDALKTAIRALQPDAPA